MGGLEQRYLNDSFFQIFTLRVKIWKKKRGSTLLPQPKWAINRDTHATKFC
jgi:hypothetical protein